jgi:hypothetical protein
MVIDSINLLLLVQYSNFSKKILNDFIWHLQRIPIQDNSTKPEGIIVLKFNSKNLKGKDQNT